MLSEIRYLLPIIKNTHTHTQIVTSEKFSAYQIPYVCLQFSHYLSILFALKNEENFLTNIIR